MSDAMVHGHGGAGSERGGADRERGGADRETVAAGRATRTLFIANRGEIARRIATTADRLGIEAVIPALDGPDALDLLDADAVVKAAHASGADAVHPGYGFLAESPRLAEAVAVDGLIWVGPPPDAIRTLGDKAGAREVARSVGVPVAAGEEPEDQSDVTLLAAAERIGWPVVVKPAAGGGGKGIRIVPGPDHLPAALAAARREAVRAFADDRLILERYVAPARHVEVQILADTHGSVVHLGDRDCSLQRRHQKLLEEAPAPALDAGIREALAAAAVRIAAAVGYVGAGTCEFLVGDDGTWVFLEMNARIQVEHPVTELVTGRDLVADQLAIAEGRRLADIGLEQGSIDGRLAAGGHAIEVRLDAEDPAAGFLPTDGRAALVRWPRGAAAFGPVGPSGIRVDAGIESGSTVEPLFDPMIAKVIAHGDDRSQALDRLTEALDATEVLGVVTNLRFLRRLVRTPVVAAARIRTDSLDTLPELAAAAESAGDVPGPTMAAAARLLLGIGRAGEADETDGRTWSGGWRLNGPRTARLRIEADGAPVDRWVAVDPDTGDTRPAAADSPPMVLEPALDGRPATVHVSIDGRSVAIRLARAPSFETAHPGTRRGSDAAAGSELFAPMPGRVIAVHVAAGDALAAGDRVVTLEAMKMEHVISAPRAGRIVDLDVREGDQVERGRVVARLEDLP